MLSHMPHWKPPCFLVDDAPQELKALWYPYCIYFFRCCLTSFIKFLITSNAFYVVLTPSTHGDFITYVSLLGSYGVWTRFPPTFVIGMFSKHGAYVVLKKLKMWKCGVESYKTFMMWCTCPSIMEKQLMTSKSVRGLLWKKTFINIGLVIRGQIISRLITINLVSDNIYHGLVFKIILFHPYALCLCL